MEGRQRRERREGMEGREGRGIPHASPNRELSWGLRKPPQPSPLPDFESSAGARLDLAPGNWDRDEQTASGRGLSISSLMSSLD